MTARGFTTVELVVVIILLAVLSAAALPRLIGRTAFEARALADELASTLRQAQRSALAMRRPVTVVVAAPMAAQPCAVRLCLDTRCSRQVVSPATGAEFCVVAQPPMTLSASGGTLAGLQFDARGRPSGRFTYTVASGEADAVTRRIVVEAGSGLVRAVNDVR